jgi:hypothetical protein
MDLKLDDGGATALTKCLHFLPAVLLEILMTHEWSLAQLSGFPFFETSILDPSKLSIHVFLKFLIGVPASKPS